jgi:hypothetical protein
MCTHLPCLQNGVPQHLGMLAHKEPHQCPIVMLGMYELFRFDIKGEEFPDLAGPLDDL